MLNTIIGFFSDLMIKYIGRLPSVPYSYNGFLSGLNQYIGYINYFIPFYRLKTMFDLWAVAFSSTLAIIMIFTWAKNMIGR